MALMQENISVPTQRVKITSPSTIAFVDTVNLGTGDLYVTEDHLIWREENGMGFCFEYPKIALHAISRDLTAFPHECLYMIVDKDDEREDLQETADADADVSDEIKPMRFVPSDKGLISSLFTAINECQAMHPDSSSENCDDQDEYDDEDEDNEHHANGNGHYQDAEVVETELVEEIAAHMNDANTDPNEVQLSERGRQILRRLNINYQNQTEAENSNNEQFEDAANM